MSDRQLAEECGRLMVRILRPAVRRIDIARDLATDSIMVAAGGVCCRIGPPPPRDLPLDAVRDWLLERVILPQLVPHGI